MLVVATAMRSRRVMLVAAAFVAASASK